MIDNCIDFILKAVYPPLCILCGAPGETSWMLCGECRQALPRNTSCCGLCALPLPESAAGKLCGACRSEKPSYDRVLAPLLYADPADRLIAGFKFHGQLHTGRLLAQLLGDHIEEVVPDMPEALLPVPLHPRRIRQRGYNQALELARALSRRFRIPLDYHSCARLRPTPPQAGLNARVRRGNLRNAFSVSPQAAYRHVVIVDDVVTTGSTVNELARTLKCQGIGRVDAWTLARTASHP